MEDEVERFPVLRFTKEDRSNTELAVAKEFLFTIFLNGQELATAMHYGVNPIIIIINNSMYGTIRMNQEAKYPGVVSGTDLTNPDFAAYARSFGANGETVNTTEEFFPIFERAYESDTASVIEIITGPNDLGPGLTLSDATDENDENG